uniref:RING-type domain-containing protein n=1 Tax=Setaria italica TaxID=4555 RepID=K3YCD2_SETIT
KSAATHTAADAASPDHQTCCSICLEDFEDAEDISVMPCSGGHEFHTNCVAKWLGQYSNMCPLCRHALPTAVDDR